MRKHNRPLTLRGPALRALLGCLVGVEAERGGVYAVALSGRRGAVIEDVALVRPAHGAVHLRAAHEEAAVFLGLDVLLVRRRPEARPARPGVVLGLGAEERFPAACTQVDAVFFVIPVLTREGPLGTLHAGYAVLLGRELLLPVLVGLVDLLRRIGHESDSNTPVLTTQLPRLQVVPIHLSGCPSSPWTPDDNAILETLSGGHTDPAGLTGNEVAGRQKSAKGDGNSKTSRWVTS